MASKQAQKYLTKSLFQIGVSCPRKLVYASQGWRRCTETNVLLKSLAAEGRLWEAYARIKRFPDGIVTTTDSTIHFANTKSLEHAEANNSMNVNEALLDSLAMQTQELLFSNEQRRPLFEGVVRHGNCLVRADVLECIPYDDATQIEESTSAIMNDSVCNKRGKIRLTEIKAKSFDTQSKKDPIWSSRGGGIKSDILPYIHDAAFQTMVLENAFPDYKIETFLLVPDKAQTNQLVGLNQLTNLLMTKFPNKTSEDKEQYENARKAILNTKEDLSAWIDVTKAVQYVLDSPLEYPGGSGTASFREVAEIWSQSLNDTSNTLSNDAPLGVHCRACEFRLEGLVGEVHDTSTGTTAPANESGFHQCWTERSGLSPKMLTEGDVVIDMWNGQKKTIKSFIDQGKFLLSDLKYDDLGFSEEGLELDKKGNPISKKSGDGISRSRRQFYQATGIPSVAKYIGDQTYMETEMQEWVYPFHLIDFETATPVLPYFSNMKAFEPIAFQFSHHILYEDGKVHHSSEFLNTHPQENPIRSFAEALSEAVGNCEGSVFRWGSHENTILTKVLQSFEEHDPVYEKLAPLLSGSDRAMVDLQKIATMGYYVAGSDASSSVKKVLLPTMNASLSLEQIYGEPTYSSKNFTNMQWFRRDENGTVCDPYHILKEYNQSQGAVADGGAALSAYHTLLSPHVTDPEHMQLEASLLRYCELDTLAMVMIIQAWQEFFLSK
jgi:hypothetical protein